MDLQSKSSFPTSNAIKTKHLILSDVVLLQTKYGNASQ